MMRLLLTFLAVVLAYCTAHARQPKVDGVAGDMIDRYRLARGVLRNQSSTFRVVIETSVGGAPGDYSLHEYDFRSDGDRTEEIRREWEDLREFPDGQAQAGNAMFRHVLWGDDGLTLYQRRSAGMDVVVVQRRVPKDTFEWRSHGRHPGAALDGFVPGDQRPLDEVLSAAKQLSVTTDRDNGREYVLIRAVTAGGSYDVFLDPQRQYNVRKIVVERARGDMYEGQPLRNTTVPNPSPDTTQRRPGFLVFEGASGAATRFLARLDDVVLREIDKTWVPVAGCLTTTMELDDGRVITQVHQIRRQTCIIHPDFKAMRGFELDIPNGTQVLSRDEPSGIRMVWRDGKVVPEVDQSNVREREVQTTGSGRGK